MARSSDFNILLAELAHLTGKSFEEIEAYFPEIDVESMTLEELLAQQRKNAHEGELIRLFLAFFETLNEQCRIHQCDSLSELPIDIQNELRRELSDLRLVLRPDSHPGGSWVH